MMIRKIMILVLAAVLFAGGIGVVSGQTIESITISGITAPVAGATPVTTVSVSGTGVDSSATVNWEPSDSVFKPGIVYTATITMSNSSGYNFSDSTTVSVNGAEQSSKTIKDNVMQVKYTFGSTATIDISAVNLTGIITPAAGENPVTTASVSGTGVESSATVRWEPSDSVFKPDTKYTATIVVNNITGYIFTKSTTVKINEATIDQKNITSSNDVLTITHSFPQTAPVTKITSVTIDDIDTPKTEEKPDLSASALSGPSGGGVGTPEVSWDPLDSPFKLGKEYTVMVTVPVKSIAYEYNDSVSVTIEGKTQVISSIADKSKISVSYTYPKTEAAGIISSITLKVVDPVVGAKPNETIVVTSPSSNVNATMYWDTTSSVVTGKSYTATVTVTAENGRVFSSDTKVTINGKSVTPKLSSDKRSFTATYTYSTSTTVSSVVVTLNAPRTGATGDRTAIIATTPVSAQASAVVSWTPSLVSDKFEEQKQYQATVKITLPSDSTCIFDKNTVVTINGYAVTPTLNSDRTITATSHAFPATEAALPSAAATSSVKTSNSVSSPAAASTFALSLNGTDVPTPFGMIQEFVHLFFALLEPGNYLIFSNTTTAD